MLTGMEMDMAKDQKRAEEKDKKKIKAFKKEGNENRKSRKGKSKEIKRKDIRSDSGVTKAKPSSKRSRSGFKKLKPTQEGNLNNINSLFISNVYEDTNANIKLPSLAVTDSLIKDRALK